MLLSTIKWIISTWLLVLTLFHLKRGSFLGNEKSILRGTVGQNIQGILPFYAGELGTVILSIQSTSISLSTHTVFINIVLDLSQSVACRGYPCAGKAGRDHCPVGPIGKFRPKEVIGLSSGCWKHLWQSREPKSPQITDLHIVREMWLLSKFT